MNELQEQLESICTNICKGIPYEAELYNSMLFILGDDTVLYITQLTNIPNNVKYQINNTSYYYMYPEDLENKIFRIYISAITELNIDNTGNSALKDGFAKKTDWFCDDNAFSDFW